MSNQIVIIPGAGHQDDNGRYTRGHDIGLIAEVDVVDLYMRTLIESLDLDGLRHIVVNTRKHPGTKLSERHEGIGAKSIILWLSVGWHHKPKVKNGSVVVYSADSALDFAEDLSDALYEWGSCSSFGHVRFSPKKVTNPILDAADCLAVKIEPFALNGPGCEDYLRRLSALGKELGHFVRQWMVSENSFAGYQPTSFPPRKSSTAS